VNAIGKRKEDKRWNDSAARISNAMGQFGVGEWMDYKSGVEDFQLAHPFLFFSTDNILVTHAVAYTAPTLPPR
jgi:hypothetical protein